MKSHKILLSTSDVPEKLRNIASPPHILYIVSSHDVNELLAKPCLTVVGSRKVSTYGTLVTTQLVREVALAGIVIISGLAFGVDSVAHKSALEVDGATIAVLPGPLDQVYPAAHRALAQHILDQGGALISEYPPGSPIYKQNFIARNRLETGISDAVLITEAAEKSGTLHTANFALEQGKEVLAVPGNITSPTSVGTNRLIKSGATPVLSAEDVLAALGLTKAPKGAPMSSQPHEQTILTLLYQGVHDAADLLEQSKLEVSLFNQALTMLEIQGRVRPFGGNQWGLI